PGNGIIQDGKDDSSRRPPEAQLPPVRRRGRSWSRPPDTEVVFCVLQSRPAHEGNEQCPENCCSTTGQACDEIHAHGPESQDEQGEKARGSSKEPANKPTPIQLCSFNDRLRPRPMRRGLRGLFDQKPPGRVITRQGEMEEENEAGNDVRK